MTNYYVKVIVFQIERSHNVHIIFLLSHLCKWTFVQGKISDFEKFLWEILTKHKFGFIGCARDAPAIFFVSCNFREQFENLFHNFNTGPVRMGSNKSKNTVQGMAVTDVMSRDWTPAFQMSLKQWRKSTMRFHLGFSTSVSHTMPSREYLTWQWSTQGRCLWARYKTVKILWKLPLTHVVRLEGNVFSGVCLSVCP